MFASTVKGPCSVVRYRYSGLILTLGPFGFVRRQEVPIRVTVNTLLKNSLAEPVGRE